VDNQEHLKTGYGQQLHLLGPHTQHTCNITKLSATHKVTMTTFQHKQVRSTTSSKSNITLNEDQALNLFHNLNSPRRLCDGGVAILDFILILQLPRLMLG
jgi:hypothetical protein